MEKRGLAFPGFAFLGGLPQFSITSRKKTRGDSHIFSYLEWMKLPIFLTLARHIVLVSEVAFHVPVLYASDNVKFGLRNLSYKNIELGK